jgi:hypothetical protein
VLTVCEETIWPNFIVVVVLLLLLLLLLLVILVLADAADQGVEFFFF